jgi:uncharacterized protein YggT (Ycf19 family)
MLVLPNCQVQVAKSTMRIAIFLFFFHRKIQWHVHNAQLPIYFYFTHFTSPLCKVIKSALPNFTSKVPSPRCQVCIPKSPTPHHHVHIAQLSSPSCQVHIPKSPTPRHHGNIAKLPSPFHPVAWVILWPASPFHYLCATQFMPLPLDWA